MTRKRPLVHLSLSPEAIARLAEIATRCGETRSGVVEKLIREAEVIASDVGAYLEQKAELEAAYARIKELMAEAEKEEVRWQERIAAVITSAGLTPIDASGNESGDPLDWTADQVAAALGELNAAADESRAHDGALSAFSPEQRAELEKPIAPAPALDRWDGTFLNCCGLRQLAATWCRLCRLDRDGKPHGRGA